MENDFHDRDEPRYPGLPPAATPDEIAERERREAERERRQMSVADAMRIRDAAPDLLAACEELLASATQGDMSQAWCPPVSLLRRAEAAIAKARGKA